ncbi:UNVERIFIED_CONTAM: ABC transporter A family member 7 [Sesamum radiatum]|uniref:ABC transporter A family member 7 n=1 Tax=Sesamum radiatum TaxID=300843 RepID=A0AAW2PMN7_SESRA
MSESSNGPSTASFWTQANALLRKNLIFQASFMYLTLLPQFLVLMDSLLHALVETFTAVEKHNFIIVTNWLGQALDCRTLAAPRNGQCERRCGIEYSTLDQVFTCSIPHPPPLPPLLQIPSQQYRAVRTDFILYGDLPDDSCKRTGVAGNMFARPLNIDLSNILYSLADDALGSETKTRYTNYLDPAFSSDVPVDFLQPQCTSNSQFSVPVQFGSATFQQDVRCVQGLQLWRNSSSEINDELYKGYRKGNAERKINEIVAAYDFMNSNENLLNVTIWYNSTYKNDTGTNLLP